MKKIFLTSFIFLAAQVFSQAVNSLPTQAIFAGLAMALPVTFAGPVSRKITVQRIQLSTGVELEYAEQGNEQGVPVVLLHGLPDSWHSFETVLPHLPASLHVFALTQRGHGNSGKPAGGFTPRDFANDLAAFIRQKNLGSAVIAGHSMGGVVAQQFALLYPNMTRALVIINSDPAVAKNPGMPEFYQEVKQMKGPQNRVFMEDFQKSCLSAPIDSTYFHRLVDESMKAPYTVFKAAFKGLMHTDLTDELKFIACPTLIFWGDQDALFCKHGQAVLRRHLPGAHYRLYEGVGHSLHWQEPARFAKDLLHFIQALPFAASAEYSAASK